MKILLTAINAKYIHSNLAVYTLKAYANTISNDISIAEYTINQQLDDILMDIYRHKPDILCFSCYLWNIVYVETLIVELQKILPETKIWLGGPEVSYNAGDVLTRLPQVSGVIIGEGEATFLELVQCLQGEGGTLSDISGIAYRNEEMIIINPQREPLDLSQVPFVYERLEDFKNKIIYYETSRGCPFACSYCLSSIDRRLRFRSMERVKRELQFFLDSSVSQVKFVDRTFNCNHDHAMEIWNYIALHDNGKTNFHFEVAADLLNDAEMELIATMRPGLIQLEIGVQSINKETLREIRRVMDFKKVEQAVKRVQAGHNVHQHLDLIAGLPYENYQSFSQSFDAVYALKPDQLQLGFLKVLKGSHMEDMAASYGLKYQSRPPFEVLSTSWLTYAEMIRLKGVENMVEIYYNSEQFVHTLEKLEQSFSSAFSMYEALSAFYMEQGIDMMSHSRITRYEVLFCFASLYGKEEAGHYRELLTYDLYLRENVKSRPAFAGEPTVTKAVASEVYGDEAQIHQLLKGYERFDKRQLRKMTHLERIKGEVLLFDYQNRDPLTNQATVIRLVSGE